MRNAAILILILIGLVPLTEVTADEIEKPEIILTPPAAVSAEATGPLTATAIGKATAVDDDGKPVKLSNDAPAAFPVGVTTVTWTAWKEDVDHGVVKKEHVTTAAQVVTITDTTPPTITIQQPAITVEATAAQTAVNLGTVTASDLVDGSITPAGNAPSTFPVGTTTITYTATDAEGNVATATQTVTVTDTAPPVIIAPANISLEATAASMTVAIGVATANDLVDGIVAVTNDAPAVYPVGTTTITYTATDAAGNTATETQTVTITDTTPPVISVQQPAITIEATAVQMSVALGTVTATDLVDGTLTPVNDAPATFPLGITTVTYTATDAAGNSATAQQQVTVQDTTPPAITAPVAVSADSNTGQPIAVAIGVATAMDVFTPVSITSNAPAAFPIGDTTVTWTATDANGNSATATQVVTVVDTSILTNLPPDPGNAGKATLEGIDSDNDGVRDDVQRWIAITYPDSEKTRAALTQMAKAMQTILLNAADAVNARTYSLEADRAAECIGYVRDQILGVDNTDDYQLNREMEAIYLNTYERSKAWLQHDKHLSGMFFSMLPDPKQGCDFNPDLMAN